MPNRLQATKKPPDCAASFSKILGNWDYKSARLYIAAFRSSRLIIGFMSSFRNSLAVVLELCPLSLASPECVT